MNIRQATAGDIAAIVKLFWELDTGSIREQPEHFQRGERTHDYLTAIINGEKSDFLLATLDEQVIGFALLYEREVKGLSLLVPCTYAYVQDFVVAQAHRNRGVGSLLLAASKQWASAHGLDYLRLAVLPQNMDARRFYARNGLYEQMITMECPVCAPEDEHGVQEEKHG